MRLSRIDKELLAALPTAMAAAIFPSICDDARAESDYRRHETPGDPTTLKDPDGAERANFQHGAGGGRRAAPSPRRRVTRSSRPRPPRCSSGEPARRARDRHRRPGARRDPHPAPLRAARAPQDRPLHARVRLADRLGVPHARGQRRPRRHARGRGTRVHRLRRRPLRPRGLRRRPQAPPPHRRGRRAAPDAGRPARPLTLRKRSVVRKRTVASIAPDSRPRRAGPHVAHCAPL
jgi:hypothetical protein